MHKFVLLAFFFVQLLPKAQIHKEEITKDFSTYYTLFSERKFEAAIKYIDPSIFQVVAKSELLAGMKSIFALEGVTTILEMPSQFRFRDPQIVENTTYVLFTAKTGVKMRLEDYVGKPERISELLAVYNQIYGEDNVGYDAISGFFWVRPEKKFIASSTALGTWKFLAIDKDEVLELLSTVLPAEIISAASLCPGPDPQCGGFN